MKSLLEYSGGFTGDAYEGMVRLARQSGTENELYNIERGEFASYRLQDGDIITVGTILDRYANRVELKGAVYRPGMFAIGRISTHSKRPVKSRRCDRRRIHRPCAPLSRRSGSGTTDNGPRPQDILEGRAKDVTLKRNDVLVISSIHELEERGASQ